jgi:hypothetical protein
MEPTFAIGGYDIDQITPVGETLVAFKRKLGGKIFTKEHIGKESGGYVQPSA